MELELGPKLSWAVVVATNMRDQKKRIIVKYYQSLSQVLPIRTSNVVLTPRCRLNCIILSGDCYIGTSGSKTGCGTPRLEVGHLASLRTSFMAGEYQSAQRRLSFSVSFKASASPSVHWVGIFNRQGHIMPKGRDLRHWQTRQDNVRTWARYKIFNSNRVYTGLLLRNQ